MPFDLPKIDIAKREPLPIEIARKLVEYLLSGGFEPGQRLPAERHLAEAFGVGRSIIREALKSLTLLGLIEVRQGDGTYLKSTTSEFLPRVIEWGMLLGERRTLDLVELRYYLEIVVARLAAERRDETALARLKELLQSMEEARFDQRAFVEADVAFHLVLAEACGNSALKDILSSIWALLDAWITRVIAAAGDTRPSYLEHVPIYQAVERSDGAAAAAAMEAHMMGATGRLRAALSSKQHAEGKDQAVEPSGGEPT